MVQMWVKTWYTHVLKERSKFMFLYKDMKYYDTVRENIRKYRIEKNYTQSELAEKSDLSVDYINEIESLTKNKTFSIRTVGRIADALEIEMYKLFIKSDVLSKNQ